MASSNNRKLVLLLLLMLAIFILLAWLLYTQAIPPTPLPAADRQNLITDRKQHIQPLTNDLIRKIPFESDKIRYELIGYLFDTEIDQLSGLVAARFGFLDGVQSPTVPVILGTADGVIILGSFTPAQPVFTSAVTWSITPTAQALRIIDGNQVLLRFDLSLEGDDQSLDYSTAFSQALDAHITTTRQGDYSLDLPQLSSIAIPAVGVERP